MHLITAHIERNNFYCLQSNQNKSSSNVITTSSIIIGISIAIIAALLASVNVISLGAGLGLLGTGIGIVIITNLVKYALKKAAIKQDDLFLNNIKNPILLSTPIQKIIKPPSKIESFPNKITNTYIDIEARYALYVKTQASLINQCKKNLKAIKELLKTNSSTKDLFHYNIELLNYNIEEVYQENHNQKNFFTKVFNKLLIHENNQLNALKNQNMLLEKNKKSLNETEKEISLLNHFKNNKFLTDNNFMDQLDSYVWVYKPLPALKYLISPLNIEKEIKYNLD